MRIHYSTGNKVVDAVGEMNLTGNIIPEAWYRTITSKTKANREKPCPLAILLLADIVYWYRPTEYRDESTQSVMYRKKFYDADYLQRSYEQISEKFGISKKQARDALIVLEKLGVVKRHFRDMTTSSGIRINNIMYLELFPDVLKKLTYLKGTPYNKNVNTPLQKRDDLITFSSPPLYKNVETNTQTTAEITQETSTTTVRPPTLGKASISVVVDAAKEIFADLGLPDKDISEIVKASGGDINKCKNAMQVLLQQTKHIGNMTGWLISAVKEDYRLFPKASAVNNNQFNRFEQREYSDEDMDEIERELLASSG